MLGSNQKSPLIEAGSNHGVEPVPVEKKPVSQGVIVPNTKTPDKKPDSKPAGLIKTPELSPLMGLSAYGSPVVIHLGATGFFEGKESDSQKNSASNLFTQYSTLEGFPRVKSSRVNLYSTHLTTLICKTMKAGEIENFSKLTNIIM